MNKDTSQWLGCVFFSSLHSAVLLPVLKHTNQMEQIAHEKYEIVMCGTRLWGEIDAVMTAKPWMQNDTSSMYYTG